MNLFVHFTVNTFTDKEWGYGDENPDVFNPTALDCRQWAKAAKEAGFKGIILTAKHHDGFCLWPSKYTEHSVKYSKWRNGEGDVLRELRKACDEYGLKMGVYLSPWDRNSAKYGTPDYITYYRNQLKELTTEYGKIFEVWFDGANGGDGYYGGAKEKRTIDRRTYYDWNNTRKVVRENQPEAVMFGDGGPDIRWVGNESGMETSKHKVGLIGVGLDTYWGQFEGLLPRLIGYQKEINNRITALGATVIDGGMVDTPEKALAAAGLLKSQDVELLFIFISTYALSSTVLPIAEQVKVPIVLLNVQPVPAIDYDYINGLGDRGKMTGEWLAHCQACSAPEFACVFNRAGIKYDIVTGYLHDAEIRPFR